MLRRRRSWLAGGALAVVLCGAAGAEVTALVFLNFWASWCAECRPEMSVLERLHRELGSRGLAVDVPTPPGS